MVLDRRDFLKLSALVGGGVLLSVHTACSGGEKPVVQPTGSVQAGPYLAFHPDGRVEVFVPKPDLGQGVRTALMMVVAEELNLDPAAITVRQAPFDVAFGDQQTSGSYGLIGTWPQMRLAGAAARDMFRAAAAKVWKVKASTCEVRNGVVYRPGTPDGLSFAQLLERPQDLRLPKKPHLKTADQFRIIGTPVHDVDLLDAVTGKKAYGMDYRPEGLVFAAVARCPYPGGGIISVDDEAAKAMPGVLKLVRIEGTTHPTHVRAGIAVIATSTWRAMQAAGSLVIQWRPPPKVTAGIEDLRQQAEAALQQDGVTVLQTGTPTGAPDKSLDLWYETAFLAHAPMEPLNCTAFFSGGRCRLHAPTQAPAWVAEAVAAALSIPKAQVSVEVALMGGGFGRKVNPDTAVEAALIAREIDRPVQVVWTREDDIRGGFYRPFTRHRIQVDLHNGSLDAWRHHMAVTPLAVTYNGPDVAAPHQPELHGGTHDMPYHTPFRKLAFSTLDTHLTTGWWRGVSYGYNTFAVESAMDEIALALGVDPLTLRLDLLKAASKKQAVQVKRLAQVLERVGEMSAWGQKPPAGLGRGLACCWYHSAQAYVAQVVEVGLDEDGLTVRKVWTASDNGLVVNPDRVHAQIEGAVIFALGAALTGRIQLEEGRVVEGNFDTYPVPRLNQAPQMEIALVGGELKPGGAGEPGLPAVAPALTNAVVNAGGKRIRRLPIGDQLG